MKHIFKFLSIKFSPQNSAFSLSNRFIFQLFVIVFTRVGPFPDEPNTYADVYGNWRRTLIYSSWKVRIWPCPMICTYFYKWRQSGRPFWIRRAAFDVSNMRCIILIGQLNINWQLTFLIWKWSEVNSRRKHTNIYGRFSVLKEWQPEVFKRE